MMGVDPKDRSDWPLPSFDARDWAKSFMDTYEKAGDDFFTEDVMVGWFANALMRGYDEGFSRANKENKIHLEKMGTLVSNLSSQIDTIYKNVETLFRQD
jgi:flagellar biosynthesis/type III secretory pathway protein FliH